MKRFISNIILFSIPIFMIIVGFMAFYMVGIVTGEFMATEELPGFSSSDNIAVGLGYNEQTAYYKLINANRKQADVLVLGTSRAMQFREIYFKSSFYNCGGSVHGNYREYKNFLENLTYTPKILILDLDSWVFNDNWNKFEKDYTEFEEIIPVERTKIVMAKQILLDFINEKWTFESINRYPNNVGFNGRIKDDGFYSDGSYHYGEVGRDITLSTDYGFVDTFNRIDAGKLRFEYGEHIDEDTLAQLEELLEYCADNNIYVVAYQAPFAPSVYERMAESGNYGYLEEISPACEKLFNKYGFEYYDYSDVSGLGITDEYFVDGFHGSEVVYAMIIDDIVKRCSNIRGYVDCYIMNDYLSDLSHNNILLVEPRGAL